MAHPVIGCIQNRSKQCVPGNGKRSVTKSSYNCMKLDRILNLVKVLKIVWHPILNFWSASVSSTGYDICPQMPDQWPLNQCNNSFIIIAQFCIQMLHVQCCFEMLVELLMLWCWWNYYWGKPSKWSGDVGGTWIGWVKIYVCHILNPSRWWPSDHKDLRIIEKTRGNQKWSF